MDLQWTVFVQKRGATELVKIGSVGRPVNGAAAADFGLSIPEGRALLASLQQVVGQHQVAAYDELRRRCRRCGRYRRIKDWRYRTIATGLGQVKVRVPRVVSCLCTPEPLDEDDQPISLRFTECPVDRVLPRGRTPEVAYLCAKHGASTPYRSAARAVADLAGLRHLCHTTVRRETIACGEHIENAQFHVGWYAGGRKSKGARHLRVAIDGTFLTASTCEECSKFEVIAGRVECDGQMGRRFVSAMQRPTLTRVLVAAALEQCGWVPGTLVDVVTDGARGMRSMVTSVAPNVAPKILDWFHLGMKLHTVKSPLFARPLDWREPPAIIQQCGRMWRKVRDALWRGRGEKAIELVRTLIVSLKEEVPFLPAFYAGCAMTAAGAAAALLKFLVNNRRDLIDYQRARMAGRRISSASAESVMNHLVNSRMSKRQQMRWSIKGAHCLLQTRVELLDGRLQNCFASRFPHFRSPELRRAP
ncbi:MAG: ISKra4 family transposase [Rubrivivax sp.]|nr:ISKra4 family transposase [Rubrivivax sp.]